MTEGPCWGAAGVPDRGEGAGVVAGCDVEAAERGIGEAAGAMSRSPSAASARPPGATQACRGRRVEH